MLDTIADIRSRLGTCRQRDADAAMLLGIVDSLLAKEARLRGDYEAYVRNNCQLIRHSVVDGLGYPEEVNGKCGGYAQNYDEPHETCQKCVAVYDPETELDPPGPVAELVEAVGNVDAVINSMETYGKGLDVRNDLQEVLWSLREAYAKVVGGNV